MFSLDVKNRCQRIHSELLNMHASDSKKVSALMPRDIESTLNCYGGDCTKCRYYTQLCVELGNNKVGAQIDASPNRTNTLPEHD